MSKIAENLIRRKMWRYNPAYGNGCYTTSKSKIGDLINAGLLTDKRVPNPITPAYLESTDFNVVKNGDNEVQCWIHTDVSGEVEHRFVIYNA
jgi:hypothetical protein